MYVSLLFLEGFKDFMHAFSLKCHHVVGIDILNYVKFIIIIYDNEFINFKFYKF